MNLKKHAKQRLLKLWGREPHSLDDLGHCTIAVINRFLRSQIPRRPRRVVGFSWNVSHTDAVSNSHECPIDGVTNWDVDLNYPCGYPGWSGRVWVRYDREIGCFGSDPFRPTLTYTGTGGAGGYGGPWSQLNSVRYEHYRRTGDRSLADLPIYSWDYRFFDADWPDLCKGYLLDMLRDDNRWRIHSFRWADPEVEAQDDEFLRKHKEKS